MNIHQLSKWTSPILELLPRLVKKVNNVLNVAVYQLTRSLITSSCNNQVINQTTIFYSQMIQKASFEPLSKIFISLGRNRPIIRYVVIFNKKKKWTYKGASPIFIV
jgi:hypothetical protein